jgi:pilus assembly protein FimV
MTDPERISKRSTGLAAELLRSANDEQPGDAGVQSTLAALGITGAILSTTSVAGASLAGAQAGVAGAGTSKAVGAALLVKWIGIGVVGGVGIAGAAAVVSAPAAQPAPASVASVPAARVVALASAPLAEPAPTVSAAPPLEPLLTAPVVVPRSSVGAPLASAEIEVGAPLAAEVALVDRARSLLAAGRAEQGLALLTRYEHEFPEARLLPEVLFLQLETFQRLARHSEARRAAQRLVSGFPKSPHATRARALLSNE